jgi:hypothetical protein
MNKNIQKLKKEIFDTVMNNKEEKDVEAIISSCKVEFSKSLCIA